MDVNLPISLSLSPDYACIRRPARKPARAKFNPLIFTERDGVLACRRAGTGRTLLNATAPGTLTPEYLFDVINAKGVIADTIFQAVMNVELGTWNVSQPDL